jgi:FeS assembly SUF system protein
VIKTNELEPENEFLQLEDRIIKVLKNIYDPEIPVNIYDLGLIYELDADDDNNVKIKMTLTTPNCPIAGDILREVRDSVEAVEGVKSLDLKLTFDPPWDESNLSEEARLELGLM